MSLTILFSSSAYVKFPARKREEERNDDNGSYERVFRNAIPMPIFVVDDDVRILDLNDAASRTFHLNPARILKQRGGDSQEGKGLCGQESRFRDRRPTVPSETRQKAT
jgi:PAS domain-containing protein